MLLEYFAGYGETIAEAATSAGTMFYNWTRDQAMLEGMQVSGSLTAAADGEGYYYCLTVFVPGRAPR